MLLLAPTALATQAFVAPPVGNPTLFAPQLACVVVLTGSTFEDCRFDGFVASATHARIVLQQGATATFRVDDDTLGRQGGQGSCSLAQCTLALNYAVTGDVFVTFKVWGAPGAIATIELHRERL